MLTRPRHLAQRIRRGFTLLEALMASGILLAAVVAVTSAITAGQQHAYEAHQRIAASLAAEELLGRVIIDDYANLMTFNGLTQAVGTMTDVNGSALPQKFDSIGRDVSVINSLEDTGVAGVNIQGRTVRVRAFDANNRVLADISQFIPEPPSS